MTMRFDDRVVLITGAGQGLGRDHAFQFAARGARVVVNDAGTMTTGAGMDTEPADQVVEEIVATGGEAVANHDSASQGKQLVQCALDNFGRIDVLVHNAGMLRDRAFYNMTEDDWDEVYQAHLKNAFKVSRAAWPYLREQQYGRLVFTSSTNGLYGNFGQANDVMVQLGLHGFCQTLALEGQNDNILANTVVPVADSRLSTEVLPARLQHQLRPEHISPLILKLCHESHDQSGGLYEAAAGRVNALHWERSQGHVFTQEALLTPEAVHENWPRIVDFRHAEHPTDAQHAFNPLVQHKHSG